jgi:hypothetical protein
MVTLVLSGALLPGCDDPWQTQNDPPSPQITNNTYAPGYGYWHAPYHSWYPYPYNYFRPGYGYYHGGIYSAAPDFSPIRASADPRFGADGHSFGSRRGGFGGSARGVGS